MLTKPAKDLRIYDCGLGIGAVSAGDKDAVCDARTLAYLEVTHGTVSIDDIHKGFHEAGAFGQIEQLDRT